jgi:UDP-glucuronate 4-epimerase
LFLQFEGIHITCIDDFDDFYPADLKQLNIRDFKANPHFHFRYLDISENSVQDLQSAIQLPVDAIVHIAAKAGVRPSIENPLAYQRTNIIGLQLMLDFAKVSNIKTFVFASSSSVYGINNHFPMEGRRTIDAHQSLCYDKAVRAKC